MYTIKKMKNNYIIKKNDMDITLNFKCNIPFGIEEYNEKKIVNIEIDKKTAAKIIEIEDNIRKLFPTKDFNSTIKKRKFNKFLLRTHLRYKNNKLYTKLYNINTIKTHMNICVDIYIDKIWLVKNNVGIIWYINYIKD